MHARIDQVKATSVLQYDGYRRRQVSDIYVIIFPKLQHILKTWIGDVTDGKNDMAEGTMQDQKVARHDAVNVLIELHEAMVNSLLYISSTVEPSNYERSTCSARCNSPVKSSCCTKYSSRVMSNHMRNLS